MSDASNLRVSLLDPHCLYRLESKLLEGAPRQKRAKSERHDGPIKWLWAGLLRGPSEYVLQGYAPPRKASSVADERNPRDVS